jgi:hypothetical protein
LDQLARVYLQPDGHAAPAVDAVVHVDDEVLRGAPDGRSQLNGRAIAPEAARRLVCDATILTVGEGEVADAAPRSRRRRTLPAHLRATVVLRDRQTCRFPGCDARHHTQVHHIVHWARGGANRADNLIVLCSFHHRLVHEGGWTIEGTPDTGLIFRSPEGRTLTEAPPKPTPVGWRTISTRWRRVDRTSFAGGHGERMDLDWTVTALCCLMPPDGKRRRRMRDAA